MQLITVNRFDSTNIHIVYYHIFKYSFYSQYWALCIHILQLLREDVILCSHINKIKKNVLFNWLPQYYYTTFTLTSSLTSAFVCVCLRLVNVCWSCAAIRSRSLQWHHIPSSEAESHTQRSSQPHQTEHSVYPFTHTCAEVYVCFVLTVVLNSIAVMGSRFRKPSAEYIWSPVLCEGTVCEACVWPPSCFSVQLVRIVCVNRSVPLSVGVGGFCVFAHWLTCLFFSVCWCWIVWTCGSRVEMNCVFGTETLSCSVKWFITVMQVHTHIHTIVGFLWFIGTFQKHNDFYSVNTVYYVPYP